MDNWFTIEQIDRDTFSISEYKHWEETHCYLLCGEKYAILIDTGLGVSNIRKIVDSLTKLPVMTVTTHVHWDHIGGHKYFDNIAVHEAEKDWLSVRFPIPLQVVKNNLTRIPCDFPRDFDINAYQIFQGIPQRILHDGDFLNLGGREIQVVHTPGHSPGHCCFYEPERNYLYSGDLIYKGSLDAFYPTTDPKLFYQSIRRIRKYNIKKVLPGHHQLDIPVSLIAGNVKKCAVGKYPKSEKHGNTAQFSEVERSGTQEKCGGIGSGCRLRLRPLPVLHRRQSQWVARIDPNAVVVDKNIAENDRFDLFSR